MSAISSSRPAGQATALLLSASAGCAMTVLDTNVVGIVLPTIARELNASFADIEWVVSAYVLCFAALLLPAGAIADRFGRKRVFLLGIAAFTTASLACGLAPSALALCLARAAQGAGAAFLLASALAILGHAFHDEDVRARAWAVWGGIMGLTMVLSPLIGGALNTWLGWRSAFYLNVPVCAALAMAVVRIVDESRDPTPRRLDFAGVVSFVSAMFLLTWALILGPAHGWRSASVIWRALAGLGLFGVFVSVERRCAQPMLELALFAAWPFVGAVVAMFAYAASAQVMASLLPLFLQNARGATALAAGVGMLPFALAMLVFPQVGRWLSRRMASYRILVFGLAVVALGNILLMRAASQGGQGWLIAGMGILGGGGGLLNGETQKAIMGVVPKHRAGMASGISTTSRFTGILLGFSGLGAALAEGVRQTVLARLAEARLAVPGAVLERIVSGDVERAVGMAPAQAGILVRVAREGYGVGFSHAFLLAAVCAMAAAGVVFATMRRGAASRTLRSRCRGDGAVG